MVNPRGLCPGPPRYARLSVLPILLVVTLALGSCMPQAGAPKGDVQIKVDLSRCAARGVNVQVVMLHLERDDGEETMDIALDIEGNEAAGYIELGPGTWSLAAELYAGHGKLVATGVGTAVVMPGSVTEVNLLLSLVNGAIDVGVEWEDAPSTYIADISHRPAEVEIDGVGSFSISGLSRVGWDVQVIEIPTVAGRTHKEPGVVTYPDVVMLGLRSSEWEVASLVAWAENPSPRSMSLMLDGLGGESYRFNIFEVIPLAANTQVTGVDYSPDEVMAGIRVSIGFIEMADYTPTFLTDLPPKPEPGLWIEIDGVEADLGYPLGVLDVPGVGTSDPLFLPSARRGWNLFGWAEWALGTIEEWGGVERKNLSVIYIDENGYETHRDNFFETWPASINLFNPHKPYGENFLIDVLVVCDFIEEA